MPIVDTACGQHDLVIALERELLTTQCRADRQRVADLLHADFREYGASGRVWTRAEVIVSMADAPSVSGEAADFCSQELAEGVVLLTYRITGTRPSLRSSVWVLTAERWQMLFHQGTLTAVRG
jgi:hypothetical protein